MPQAHFIQVPKTARYYYLGSPGPHIQKLWYIIHGYGQLAGQFIKDFDILLDNHTLVVAPEALHRFYLHGGSGPIGASWMTKEDRQHDIADYLNHLNTIHDTISRLLHTTPRQITILGFSQGVATACRWHAAGTIPTNRLLLWGSPIPTDLPFEDPATVARFQTTDIHLINGTNDPIYRSRQFQQTLTTLQTHNIPHHQTTFNGQHQIKPTILAKFR